ncbi:unnamed protein product [Calypogeia fissa]
MDMIESFQEYFFKTKSAKGNNGGDNAVENDGSMYRCSTRGLCCCSRKRDCGTSTHDLTTYIWHTEGDGVGISSSVRGVEDVCGSCRTGSCGHNSKGSSFGARSQSKCCEMAQGNVCDASTSTFDLSSFVWGTDGDLYEAAAWGVDDDAEDDHFAHDLGDKDSGGRSWEGVERKRPRSDALLGFITRRNSGGVAAPPRKKKRRIGN